MLVLSRKSKQSIVIGDEIMLTVVEIKGDVVKLAIDAPRDVNIYRGELYQEIMLANREAIVDNTVVENLLQKIKK
ncbi:carbon storage regulator CsrA [Succinispira mobilis]|uniref:carbon storage regulator CsrA n=1 Tax=Succinispira mobilis TaxID=78120 RepID=UPI00036DF1E2|nr:carbon storage regulator CsrA [Succinispira mobilis]